MRYDLEDRTCRFALAVRGFVKQLPRTLSNVEDSKQLVRASGAVGANYVEGNEALGQKDFAMRMRISRKEAKECRYWLQLVDLESAPQLSARRAELLQEADELTKIFGAIIRNTTGRNRPPSSHDV